MALTTGSGGDREARPPKQKRSPGPHRRLSKERIVDGAIRVIEADGLPVLSMRRLAEDLGVVPGTLYTYVRNRTALETLVLDTVVERDGLPHELPGTWREKLEAWAWSDWHLFRAKPWILNLRMSVRESGPNMVRWLDSALRVFEGFDVSESAKLHMIGTLDAYVHGASAVHQQAADAEDPPPSSMAEQVEAAFAVAPALQRALNSGVRPFDDERFGFGLRCLLDGFQATVEGSARPRGKQST